MSISVGCLLRSTGGRDLFVRENEDESSIYTVVRIFVNKKGTRFMQLRQMRPRPLKDLIVLEYSTEKFHCAIGNHSVFSVGDLVVYEIQQRDGGDSVYKAGRIAFADVASGLVDLACFDGSVICGIDTKEGNGNLYLLSMAKENPQLWLEGAKIYLNSEEHVVSAKSDSHDYFDLKKEGISGDDEVQCKQFHWKDIAGYLMSSYHARKIYLDGEFLSPEKCCGKKADFLPSAPVAGKTAIFSLSYNVDNDKSQLFVTVLQSRIPYIALQSPTWSFVPNTNVHCLPVHCAGVLVAFCFGRNINPTKDFSKSWYLGVILYHGMSCTRIARVKRLDGSQKYSTMSKGTYRLDESIITVKGGCISLQYLNCINEKCVSLGGLVKASLEGPDVLQVNASYRIAGMKLSSKEKLLLPTAPVVTSGSLRPRGLLQILHRCQVGTCKNYRVIKKRTMSLPGTHVVEIEGPLTFLRHPKSPRKDVVLVPLLNKEFGECTAMALEKYVYFPINKYRELSKYGRSFNSHSRFIHEYGEETICLRKYHLSHYKNGLIFVYRPNDTLTKPVIICEYDTTEPKEHSDFRGVVLSHWHRNENTYNITGDILDLVHCVYGAAAFGNRKSVKCRGLNAYSGIRRSNRAIGNPVTAPEEVTLSQMWRSTGDITYAPIVNKVLNSLTQQAGCVMGATNNLLDRFYFTVLKNIYPDILNDSLVTFRRHCSLSIFTAGTAAGRCDSFFNTPHTDNVDIMDKQFQEEATKLLCELKEEYSCYSDVMQDVKYLELLSYVTGGFSVPTTCGYSFVEVDKQTSERDRVCADFALLGLGVAVELCPKSYHYFFGSAFSHCTPVSLVVKDSGIIKSYTGKHNFVGWGGSASNNDNVYEKKNN